MTVKGILLAGGNGTRLHPLTLQTNKHLLPVYDKPLIYYSLSTLMLAGIRDVLVITRPSDAAPYSALLGDGSKWGMNITYKVQPEPNGIAQAFLIGRDFIGDDACCLVLGDNIFFGHGFGQTLQKIAANAQGAHIFGYWVRDPERFGVIEYAPDGEKVIGLEEKPANPKSSYAAVGLYFYGPGVADIAASLKPSPRGELEITDLNKVYLEQGNLFATKLQRGFSWYDAGTPLSLMDAGMYFAMIERHQGLKVACPEEIAWRSGWITSADLAGLIAPMAKSEYGQYLASILAEEAAAPNLQKMRQPAR